MGQNVTFNHKTIWVKYLCVIQLCSEDACGNIPGLSHEKNILIKRYDWTNWVTLPNLLYLSKESAWIKIMNFLFSKSLFHAEMLKNVKS